MNNLYKNVNFNKYNIVNSEELIENQDQNCSLFHLYSETTQSSRGPGFLWVDFEETKLIELVPSSMLAWKYIWLDQIHPCSDLGHLAQLAPN